MADYGDTSRGAVGAVMRVRLPPRPPMQVPGPVIPPNTICSADPTMAGAGGSDLNWVSSTNARVRKLGVRMDWAMRGERLVT
jgi:hypothetical protein